MRVLSRTMDSGAFSSRKSLPSLRGGFFLPRECRSYSFSRVPRNMASSDFWQRLSASISSSP